MQGSSQAAPEETVLSPTVGEEPTGVAVDFVPPGLELRLMSFGVVLDTTISDESHEDSPKWVNISRSFGGVLAASRWGSVSWSPTAPLAPVPLSEPQ